MFRGVGLLNFGLHVKMLKRYGQTDRRTDCCGDEDLTDLTYRRNVGWSTVN